MYTNTGTGLVQPAPLPMVGAKSDAGYPLSYGNSDLPTAPFLMQQCHHNIYTREVNNHQW